MRTNYGTNITKPMIQSYKDTEVKDHSDLSSLQLILLRPKFRPKSGLMRLQHFCLKEVFTHMRQCWSNYRLFKFVQNKLKQKVIKQCRGACRQSDSEANTWYSNGSTLACSFLVIFFQDKVHDNVIYCV